MNNVRFRLERIRARVFGRHDTQHNDIQQSDIQHNDIEFNDIRHNGIKPINKL